MRVRWLTSVWRWIIAWVAIVAGQTGAQVVDATEASLRILQRSVTVQRDGSHLPLLFALRQLHDRDLQPIFEKLVQINEWQVQVHGALGLAEISPDRSLSIECIKSLVPQAQDAVVATGLDLELLAPAQLPPLLEWPDLQDMARLVALAELVTINQAIPKDELQRLSTSDDLHVAAMAACLQAQGGDRGSLAALRARLDSLPPDQKLEVEFWLLDAIRRYQLTSCSDWVAQILNGSSLSSDLSYRAVFTLMMIDPKMGISAWHRQLGTSAAMSHRVRYALILLACGADVPVSAYDGLAVQKDEDLLARIVAVGKALSTKSDPVQPIIYLLDARHAKSTAWVMEFAPKLPDDQAARVYGYLIDRVTVENSDSDAVALAVRATAKLIRLDPSAVLSRLGGAADDGVKQQAILLGMFEADAPGAHEAVRNLKRIGTGRADSLALLLMAKSSESLEQADIDLLGKIASGGGRISDILQVQAAWLYIKHTRQSEKAMTSLFPPR